MSGGGWLAGARPVAVAARCVRTGFARATCDRCRRVCPREAIALGRGVSVGGACSGCGACVAACPSGALVDPGGDERALGRALAAEERGRPGRTARVACRAVGAGAGEIEVPCLGRLSADALLWAATSGVGHVEGRSADCARCPEREAVSVLDETVAAAVALATAAGAALSFRHVRGAAPPPAPASEPRRALFRSLFGVGRARDEARSPADLAARAAARRGGLLAEVRRHRDLARGDLAAAPSTAPTTSAPGWPFGVVALEAQRCIGCPVCEVVCPTGAIHREVAGAAVVIAVSQAGCTACGACAEACLPRAITVRPATARELLDGGDLKVRAGAASCPSCGRPGVTASGSLCHACAAQPGRVALRP